jgi:hypothetical protein
VSSTRLELEIRNLRVLPEMTAEWEFQPTEVPEKVNADQSTVLETVSLKVIMTSSWPAVAVGLNTELTTVGGVLSIVRFVELRLLTPVLSPATTPVPKTLSEIVPDGALGWTARTKKVLPSPAAV